MLPSKLMRVLYASVGSRPRAIGPFGCSSGQPSRRSPGLIDVQVARGGGRESGARIALRQSPLAPFAGLVLIAPADSGRLAIRIGSDPPSEPLKKSGHVRSM